MGTLSTEFAIFLKFVMPNTISKKKRKKRVILNEFRKWLVRSSKKETITFTGR